MKTIFLDQCYFIEVRRVKELDIKGEIIKFPENVFEIGTGVSGYQKLYYYADENKTYDLFIDKKDKKRTLIRVELNFYIGKKLEKLTATISKLVELFQDNEPNVIAELKPEEETKEETVEAEVIK